MMIRSTLLASLMVTGIAGAQTPNRTETRPVLTTATKAFHVKQILNSKVSIQGDISIGTVDDIVFGEDGMIDYLIIDNKGRLVTVPWEAAKFDFDKRVATVAITNEVYSTIPTYTVKEYPQFYSPAYRTDIYRYYKLTPRVDRRIDRRP